MRATVQIDHRMITLIPDMEKSNEKDGLKLKPAAMVAQGTGVVVAVRGKESLIVTAAHVCKPQDTVHVQLTKEVGVDAPVLGEDFLIWNMELDQMAAQALVIDELNDVCVMRVLGVPGDVVEVATQDPPIGARVTAVGSPHGFLNYHRAFVTDGRYVGAQQYKDHPHSDTVALPGTHGCSGGGVFYRGKLFGVMSRIREEFQEIVIIEGDAPLRDAIKKARSLWKP
jgi:S1-C subfamily serine protease